MKLIGGGAVGKGQHKPRRGMVFKYAPRRADEHPAQTPDFASPAAGQQRDEQSPFAEIQAQPVAGGGAVRLGNLIGHGMPDAGHGHLMLAVVVGLERKQRQHMINGAADFVDAVAAPRPHRGAYVVHAGNLAALEFARQREVEVRRVNAHEHVGGLGGEARRQVAADAEDARQLTEQAVQPDDADARPCRTKSRSRRRPCAGRRRRQNGWRGRARGWLR